MEGPKRRLERTSIRRTGFVFFFRKLRDSGERGGGELVRQYGALGWTESPLFRGGGAVFVPLGVHSHIGSSPGLRLCLSPRWTCFPLPVWVVCWLCARLLVCETVDFVYFRFGFAFRLLRVFCFHTVLLLSLGERDCVVRKSTLSSEWLRWRRNFVST